MQELIWIFASACLINNFTLAYFLGLCPFFGVDLFGSNFEPWVIMILPPGGFLTLGLLLLFFSWIQERKEKLAAQLAETEGGRS